MASALLTPWHIQCIHPELDTDRKKSSYITRVNCALTQIWDAEGDELHQPIRSIPAGVAATLEVAEVSNCETAYRGVSKNAVRLRFKLSSTPRPDNETVHRAVRYFCLKGFELKATGQIFPMIRTFSSHSLLGIEPLSQIFRLWWTRGFLKPLSTGGYLSSIPLLMQRFIHHGCEPLQSYVFQQPGNAGCQACAVQQSIDSENIPSDFELELFEVVFKVLQVGFEVLTINKDIYEQWVEIVSSADAKVKTAGFGAAAAFGVSVAAFLKIYADIGAAQAGTVAATAATVTVHTTAMSALTSSAVLGPLGLCAAGVCIFAMHLYFRKKASKQMDKKKRETEEIQGLYQHAQMLAQWLIVFSKPSTTAGDGVGLESQEMQELRSQFNGLGLQASYTLNDWQATLEDESNIIKEQLKG